MHTQAAGIIAKSPVFRQVSISIMKITRSDTSYADLVEIFRCEIRSVWPFYSIELDSELLEEFDILQGFEDFPLERRGTVILYQMKGMSLFLFPTASSPNSARYLL